MENEETPKRETLTFRMRENPWILSTFVLGVLVLILLVGNFSGFTGNTISEKDIGGKLAEFASSQFPDIQVTSVKKEGNLYNVAFTSSQTGASSVYVTLDGLYLINGLVPLSPSANSNTQTRPTTDVVNVNDLDLTSAPMIGEQNAPVTIIEFSDLSCPFCAAADGGNQEVIDYLKQKNPDWQAPIPAIMNAYVNTGKVKFYFKYYPGHGSGVDAQKIGWCLNEQRGDKFWKYADSVFGSQDKVSDKTALLGFAKQAGGDTTKINACLDAKKYDALIDKDTQEGRAIGVTGTPAFYINGREISGAASYEAFKKIIDEELAKV